MSLRSGVTINGPAGSQHHIAAYSDEESYYTSSSASHSESGSRSSSSAVSDSWDNVTVDDIQPSDSASRPDPRRAHHRYREQPREPHRPKHSSRPPSHRTHSTREEGTARRSRRPLEHSHSQSQPQPHPDSHTHSHSHSHPRYREHRSRVPSEDTDSVASHPHYPPHSRDGYPSPDYYDHDYYESQWGPPSRGYPPTMTSSAAPSYHPMGALVQHDPYAYPSNPFVSQPGSSNPFVPSPPPASASSSGYFHDYPGAQPPPHPLQRPAMQSRRSVAYAPDMQAMAPYYQPQYAVPPSMGAAMPYYMHPAYIAQSRHRSTSRSPPHTKKKEEAPAPAPAPAPLPPAASPAPPPPPPETEEERMQKFFALLQLSRDKEKAVAEAENAEKSKVQAESDKIAVLLQKFEEDRLAREAAAIAKAEADKTAAEAKAAREKEIADAANAAREAAEKEAANKAAVAAAENEKKIAEAKAAQEEVEKARKALEEELAKNKPDPDSSLPPLKFRDAVGRNFTLPWHLAKTWKGMEGLIKQAFLHVETIGPHVINGHYDLLGPNDEIILPQVWETVVRPDWEIKMQLWPMPDPIEEMVSAGPGGFHDFVEISPPNPIGKKPRKESSKSKPKRSSMVIPVPPGHGAMHIPPGVPMPPLSPPIVEVIHERPKKKGKSEKQLPAFTRWMIGASGRKKGSHHHQQKPVGVQISRVLV